MDKKLQIFKEK